MAFRHSTPVSPVSVAIALPETVVTNDDLSRQFDTTPEWIERKTGILSRRRMEPGEDLLDYAARASRAALRGADLVPQDVDVVVVATSTPDWVMPSFGLQLADRLGIDTPFIVDLTQFACASAIYAIHQAALQLRDGMKRALVVCPEAATRALDPTDRLGAVFFGDATGALVLERTRDDGLLAYDLGHALSFGVSLPTTVGIDVRQARGETDPSRFLAMDGPTVWSQATTALPKTLSECLGSAGIRVDDVSGFALHQANIRLLDHVVDEMGVDRDRVAVTGDSLGNTAAASPLTALARLAATGRARSGDLVTMGAIGAGFYWGSAVFRLDRDMYAEEMCD